MILAARQRVLLLAIVLLAFALRVGGLGAQELRGDEAFGYFFQQRSVQAIIDDTIRLAEPHPVASYIVQKGWLSLAGESEFALRFTSAWWSVLVVVLLVRLARRLGLAPNTQTLAALLLALSPYAIWHAQDARMYSMSLALNTLVIWLAVEALARRRWPWIAAYVAAAYAAMQTHYFSAFVLLGLSLFVVGRAVTHAPARRAVVDWLLWNIVLLALLLPWLTAAGAILGGYGGNGDSPTFAAMLPRALSVVGVGETIPPPQRLFWSSVLALLLTLGALRLWLTGANGRRALWLLACVGLLPLLITWYSALDRPIFNERYLIAALPGLLLLMASVAEPLRFDAPPRRWMQWASAAFTVLLIVGMVLSLVRYRSDPAFSKSRGWRELAQTMTALGAGLPADQRRYAQSYPDPTLWYYTGPVEHLVLPPAAQDAAGAAREVAALAAGGIGRVILAHQPNPAWDPGELARTALSRDYAQLFAQPLAQWSIEAWDLEQPTLPSLSVEFARGVRLSGAALRPEAPAPGGLLTVTLGWEAGNDSATALSGSEAVSVQLLGPDGALLAQDDRPLPPLSPPDTGASAQGARSLHGILLPSLLPEGELRLIVALYDPAAEGTPRLPTASGDDTYTLAQWALPAPQAP
jgi:hypothetical protein